MQIRIPRRAAAATAAAVVLLAGAGTWTAVASDDAPALRREDRVLEMPGARIDTSFFTSGSADGRRPAVLLGHGFGGSKDDVRAQAEKLARDGYAVLTWSARGFGASTGRIGLNDPDFEVKDVSRLIDWLAKRPEVRLDGDGDPRVGVSGSSYGGAISLLAAGHDKRVDAIAPQITYWNLADALFPDGVFKKLWAGIFFTTGTAASSDGSPPGRAPREGEAPGEGDQPPGRAPGQGGAQSAALGQGSGQGEAPVQGGAQGAAAQGAPAEEAARQGDTRAGTSSRAADPSGAPTAPRAPATGTGGTTAP
ncbi:alpha/beta fold hydrolase, partial [Streptomyces sp. CB03238]|uniref:alpha/beta hydrolase n=1 Tax=Streptomyces sp. CB03238 TaxID=1907777 RepID=UPI000A244BD9